MLEVIPDKELADLEKMLGTLFRVVFHYRVESYTKRRRTLQKQANKIGFYLRGGHYPDQQSCNLREKDAGHSGGPATYFDTLDAAEAHMMNLKRKAKRRDADAARLWHARNANV